MRVRCQSVLYVVRMFLDTRSQSINRSALVECAPLVAPVLGEPEPCLERDACRFLCGARVMCSMLSAGITWVHSSAILSLKGGRTA